MHSTNYYYTLIEVAEDCPATISEMPPVKGEKKTVANWQFDMLYDHPYEFTSDDILFSVFAERKEVAKRDRKQARESYFSKGQPCFRASPLSKRYGWGVHSNADGKIALVAMESDEYKELQNDRQIVKTKAMRSKRAK